MLFDPASVRSAVISYNIYRVTDSNEVGEEGDVIIRYKPNSNDWDLSQDSSGDAGIAFFVTTSGQIQYTSTNVAGLNYQGTITFRAKTLDII